MERLRHHAPWRGNDPLHRSSAIDRGRVAPHAYLTLRQLERGGLVERVVYPVVPPRVEYSLTVLGSTLLVPLVELADWAGVHRPDIEAARLAYDSQPDASPTPWVLTALENPR